MPKLQLNQTRKFSRSSTDLVSTYLHEIGRYPLLTHDEEITYGKQVQRMMALLNRKEELQAEGAITKLAWAKAVDLDEAELTQTIRQGQWARQKMVRANLRLVVSIAKKYMNRNLEFLDLIQEGSIGLHRGVEKFDPTQGYRFSTYAYWWIRQAITREIAQQARTIRLPIHIVEKLNKIKKAQRGLTQTLGRKATPDELAAELDLEPAKVRKFLKISRPTLSLDMRIGDNQNTELVEMLEDDSASPDDYVNHELLSQDIHDEIANLSPHAQKVISLRFGLDGEPPMTLVAVGDRLEISRERVRQLQRQAMFYLRKHHRSDLKTYLVS
ncbi:MAG: RpoD/SigA family RNA polymerase sigma factor [Thermosynechococcaceae cyanobacterium]